MLHVFFPSFTDARNYDNNFSVLRFFSWSGQRIQRCNSKSWFKDWLAWGETLAHPHSYLSIKMRESHARNETREAWPKGARRVIGRRKAKDRFAPLFSFPSPHVLPLIVLPLTALPSLIVVNSRSRRKRKEDGKPCVTIVTIILFEKTCRQTTSFFEQIVL